MSHGKKKINKSVTAYLWVLAYFIYTRTIVCNNSALNMIFLIVD